MVGDCRQRQRAADAPGNGRRLEWPQDALGSASLGASIS